MIRDQTGMTFNRKRSFIDWMKLRFLLTGALSYFSQTLSFR